MKIAMIGHKRIPSREGGIEIVVEELSRRLAAKGHDVTAYNRKSRHVAGREFETGDRISNLDGVKIKWIPTPNSSKLNAIVYSFFATVSAIFGKYDIIHFHAEGPAAMVRLAKLAGKTCVVTIHGLDWQRAKWGGFATRFLKYGESTAAKYADEIIVLSRNVQQYFRDTYNRETIFIPNGISRPSKAGDREINKIFGLEKDGYILYLGRIVPEKGIHRLIDAFKEIKSDKKLVIAGGSSHTHEYMQSLQKSAESDARIVFTGFVQGQILDSLYSNAYIYCLPSDLEGMPISLLEAMSYGNCCLTSDIPECTEVCADKAIYFEKGNTKSLKERLEELLSSPNTVEKYRKDSAPYILSSFNWDDVTEQTLQVYKDTLYE